MDYTFLAVAIVSGVFGLISIQLIQYNFFKKKKFDYKLSQAKKIDTLKLQEIRKELGIGKKAPVSEYTAEPNIIDMVQNLDMDKIKGALSMLQGNDDDLPESNPLSGIGGLIEDNPEIVQGLLEAIKSKKPEDTQTIDYE